ncbi:MAG: STAS domain-containing protein [Bacteroidetes bacterium]|nr:STAS domain-containing protein [Bacteroidota bacterium]MCL4547573.1 STAS domain-containing protein [Bacteroidota bacterium]MCL6100045.1 STAS domain-containing protein [Bacteroidota bacterium]
MKLRTEEHYGAVVIELKGNVMGGPEAQEFSDTLHKLIDENKKNVVIDLAETKFMNSSGLGMLISGYTTMKNGGGYMKLANATEKIESLLIITKLITIFEHYTSVEEALKSFK